MVGGVFVGIYVPVAFGLVGVGLLQVYIYYWMQKPIISLYEKYFEMKLAPGMAEKVVRYSDIKKVIYKSSEDIYLETRELKKIALPVSALSQADADSLVLFIKERIVE